jgi:hypothetical protein
LDLHFAHGLALEALFFFEFHSIGDRRLIVRQGNGSDWPFDREEAVHWDGYCPHSRLPTMVSVLVRVFDIFHAYLTPYLLQVYITLRGDAPFWLLPKSVGHIFEWG